MKSLAILPLFLASPAFAQLNTPRTTASDGNPAISSAQATALITANSGFVAGFTKSSPGTFSGLMATTCNASLLSQYAVVSDTFTNTAEVWRCTITGTTYYWRPQRSDFAALLNTTGGTVTLTCGQSPPSVILTGTLATNLTVNASASNCWPGAQFDIASNLILGLFSVNLTGLSTGVTKALPLNSRVTIKYDLASGWVVY